MKYPGMEATSEAFWDFWKSEQLVECTSCARAVPARDIWAGRLRGAPECKLCELERDLALGIERTVLPAEWKP